VSYIWIDCNLCNGPTIREVGNIKGNRKVNRLLHALLNFLVQDLLKHHKDVTKKESGRGLENGRVFYGAQRFYSLTCFVVQENITFPCST
jgi:hypothetical protein